MSEPVLTSPVGRYEPEVLILAPEENPQDANLLSLVSQLLEMGIAFELDENWCVPTHPPKDLSAYKSCIFPETAKAKYDKDIDAYYQGGGVLTFDNHPIDGDRTNRGEVDQIQQPGEHGRPFPS